ncbi:hypothetical protein [Paracoccus sp. MC1862]|uniref:hypothetical protein n=1 Tax=Paracoccus sp. MC1862 TaxID=2760307 RepID=UPI0016006422|nr:hypothetical protein [Paracoccus sp. MC1862]MBB1499409.1 hypothetical protein [Paracoccus sp. MC1862]QQO45367.1 hypothetical protein JGR78_03125 [Paracoccus sp. MC1862]
MVTYWSGDPESTQTPRSARFGSQPALVIILAAWAVFLGASVVQDVLGLDAEARTWLLDVGNERSFYTWFSQLLLALAGLLLVDTGTKTVGQSRWVGVQFIGLGALFFLLSADEALGFHEKVSARLTGLGGLHFAWVIPAAAVCVAGLAAAIPFLRALSPRVRALMLASAGVFLFGALGMEAIGGQVFLAMGEDVLARPYRALVNIEEGAEGLGVILFLFALTLHRQQAGLVPGISLFR